MSRSAGTHVAIIANKNPRFTGFLKRMKGLEPSTFCMASGSWVVSPLRLTRTVKRESPQLRLCPTTEHTRRFPSAPGIWALARFLCPMGGGRPHPGAVTCEDATNLVAEPLARPRLILDVAVAVTIAVPVDPGERSGDLVPSPQNERVLAGEAPVLGEEDQPKRRRVGCAVVGPTLSGSRCIFFASDTRSPTRRWRRPSRSRRPLCSRRPRVDLLPGRGRGGSQTSTPRAKSGAV